ncbi:MAG: VWA domain-containing protein [Methanolobus sp.]|nr:VWA domain-containing protein [Methanolobus sp.]
MGHFKNIIYFFLIFLIFSLSALALDVEFLTQNIQSNAGDPANISVSVTDNDGKPVNNTQVNFTTDLGNLSPSSKYTDSSGFAEISFNSTVSGTAHINASTGSAYNQTNITVLPLETSSLIVQANHSVNTAGNVTNITFYPKDVFGNLNSSDPINMNIVINDQFGTQVHDLALSISLGSAVSLDVNKTHSNDSDSSGPSDCAVLLLNSTVAGDISIDSSTGLASNNTYLQIVPGSAGLMRISYNEDYTVNTSSNVNVFVYDRYSNHIDNANVTFNVTSPKNTDYNSPVSYNSASVKYYSGLTDANGQFSNVFTTDKRSGKNTISISVANSSLQRNITITGRADNVDQFSLINNPKSAIANNIDYYTLSGRPVDQFLNPILPPTSNIKEQVRFTTGTGSVLVPLNTLGRANILLGPTPYVESVSVTATYRNESRYTGFMNSTVLDFTADVLDSIDFYAVPNTVLDQTQSGNHNSTITVVALDKWGHALPDIPVTLNNTNTTTGTLRMEGSSSIDHINATTDSNGRIYAVFTGNVSGNTSIVATSGNFSSSSNITIKSEPFMSINISVAPVNITSGSLVNVTTLISIEGELPIVRPAASAMLVLDRSGSMDPDYYAGTPLDVVLVLDRSGSMKFLGISPEQPMTDAKTAAKEFVDNLVSNSEVGVVSFAASSTTDVGLTHLNSYTNISVAHKAIDSLAASGSTAMGEGMGDANDLLINDGRSFAKKAMVVLTDGRTNQGKDQQGDNAVDDAIANGITIYTIGLGKNLDESLLMDIALETGGKYYNAPNSSELKDIYASIAQELSDYDATDVEFGVDGFTPYDYTFQGTLEMDASLSKENVTLQFEGYDFDVVFNASPNYGGKTAGEVLVQLNGENFTLIPSSNTGINAQWEDYQYNLNGLLNPVSNNVSFYDYYHLLMGSGYDGAVRNIEIVWQDYVLAQSRSSVQLSNISYDFAWDMPYFDDSYSETFLINETINDLKVQLDWENSDNELHLKLISPSGDVYSIVNDSRGYYVKSNTSEYIWIRPVFTVYPDDDLDTVEMGTWTVEVIGFGNGSEDFIISTYIDKKSATQLSSHEFMTSFDESRGDKAGLVLYSFEDLELSNTQTSYVLDNSTWAGYFTVQSDGYYTFDVSWADDSLMDIDLYSGADIVASSSGTSLCEVSKVLKAGKTYHLDIAKGDNSFTDTQFTIEVSTTVLDNIMAAYYDSSRGGSTPKFRTWEGDDSWSMEKSANYVGGWPYYLKLESNPLNSELIMCSADNFMDLNAQVWDGSSWGNVKELSDNLDHFNVSQDYYTRSFDIKYEQTSGDAVVVYMNMNVSNSTPLYSTWNGSSWNNATAVEGFSPSGNGSIEWIQLAEDPGSDDMVLVTLDDAGDIHGSVWDGSSWGKFVELATNASQDGYQCFDVVYGIDEDDEEPGGAMVSWYDQSGYVKYRIWDGEEKEWDDEEILYNSNKHVYWIKMAANPNSEEILLATQNEDKNVHVSVWDGSEWKGPLKVENRVYEVNRRSIDVAFEASSGEGMVVWGDSSRLPKYKTWDGSEWSSKSSAIDHGEGYTRWVQLTPVPETDDVFLMTSDGNHDINIQKWNGSSWTYINEMETSSTRLFECFDMVVDDMKNIVEDTPVQWSQWTASAASRFENNTLSHLVNVIDTMTADGLTAIDEGLFVANNELANNDPSLTEENSTIIIMSDGMDNAGYRSLLEEAYRAKDNGSIIYTVGFGNSESEVDPMLEEIANITGGEYYFAPNSSVLKDIFRGIAADITNFSASGTAMNIDVPYDYTTQLSAAKVTYVPGSSNDTRGNATVFQIPKPPSTGNAEPVVTTASDKRTLKWYLPNMDSGEKWGLWYQMQVEGEGYIRVILPSSSVTYTDLSSEIVSVNITNVVGTNVVSSGDTVGFQDSLVSLDLVPDENILLVGNSTNIRLTVKDSEGNPAIGHVYLYSNIGYFGNFENPVIVPVSGSNHTNFTSAIAGKAYITAYVYNDSSKLVDTDVVFVRPKGMISIS